MKLKSTIFALGLFVFNQVSAMETTGVVVSIKPLHSLVSGVIGNTGKAELLVSGNTSPHDFNLKPSQVKMLQTAKVVFYIDESFETFLRGALETLSDKVRTASVAQKASLTLLSYRKGGTWEKHKHDEYEKHKHEEHAHKDDGEHHDNHDENMHVWLDPENTGRIVKYIARELGAIYPKHRKTYQKNASAYIRKIKAMDAELKSSLKSLQDQPFVVFHDAYQYFENAYGLNAVGSITFEPGESPSPTRIKEVRDKLLQVRAKCVFREPQFSDRLVKTVIEGTDAKSGTLDPLGAGLEDGPSLYFNLMRNLGQNLKQCLE